MNWLKLDRLGPREKIGLTLAGVAVVCLVLERLVVESVVRRMRQIDSDAARELSNLQYCRSVAQEGSAVADEYAKVHGLLRVATPTAVDDLKGAIDDLAKRRNITLVSMQAMEPRKSEFSEEYSVDIGKFGAKMTDLLQFLNDLNTATGMLRVARLTLNPEKESGQVSGSMLITEAMLPPDTPQG
jgi:type II secretory pathway component PulM